MDHKINLRVSPNITHCGGQAPCSVQFHQRRTLPTSAVIQAPDREQGLLSFGTLLPGRVSGCGGSEWSRVDQQPGDGPKILWNPTQTRTQSQKLRATTSQRSLQSIVVSPLPLQPSPQPKAAQQRGSSLGEKGSCHRWRSCCSSHNWHATGVEHDPI